MAPWRFGLGAVFLDPKRRFILGGLSLERSRFLCPGGLVRAGGFVATDRFTQDLDDDSSNQSRDFDHPEPYYVGVT